jgi:serine/threonine protein kinase
MRFEPRPGDRLTINGGPFSVSSHPAVPALAFAQEGRKAVVYQVCRGADGEPHALKVFKDAYRSSEIVDGASKLAKHAALPGMSACRRKVLTRKNAEDLVRIYPELEYAALMPWVGGTTWGEILLNGRGLTREQSVWLARYVGNVLANLEARGLAHCDIGSYNITVEEDFSQVHLVDLEDMFGPGFELTTSYPQGSDGYQHHSSRSSPRGQWCAEGDRFAGAMLIAEILGWQDTRVHNAAYGESYFDPSTIESGAGERYTLLLDVLRDLGDQEQPDSSAALFEQAWRSDTLAKCPTLARWFRALDRLVYRQRDDSQSIVRNKASDSGTSVQPGLSAASWMDLSPAAAVDLLSTVTPFWLESKSEKPKALRTIADARKDNR